MRRPREVGPYRARQRIRRIGRIGRAAFRARQCLGSVASGRNNVSGAAALGRDNATGAVMPRARQCPALGNASGSVTSGHGNASGGNAPDSLRSGRAAWALFGTRQRPGLSIVGARQHPSSFFGCVCSERNWSTSLSNGALLGRHSGLVIFMLRRKNGIRGSLRASGLFCGYSFYVPKGIRWKQKQYGSTANL